jgi:gliding motility-associated-like protein
MRTTENYYKKEMKILFTLPLLVLSINSLSQIPTNGLVCYWPFNGNANDESGNGNNGIVHGAKLTIDRCGNENSAYYFNGISNSISIQNSKTLCPQNFTLSAWFKFTTNDQNSRYILSKSCDDIVGNSYCLYYEENQLQVKCDYSSSLRYYTNFNNGIWNHAAFTLDAISSISRLYLNGKLVANGIISGNTAYSADPLLFGAESDIKILYKFFEGSIDDIVIYNRALSTEEILNLYNTDCNSVSINGESEVCQGQKNVRFYVGPVESATSYTWNYSGTGATFNGSADSILIDFANNATSGDLSVTVTGNNISTQSRSIPIIVNTIPLAPETISGDNEVCTGQNGVVYAIQTINNVTSYLWNYSGTGAVINGNSNNISIDFTGSATSGNLTVTGSNGCGNGPPSEAFPIYVKALPEYPGNINGDNEVCLGQNGVPYEVTTIQNATNYLWSYSGTGSTIFGNSNSIQIYFAYDATSGNLTVAGNNDCGIGPVSEDFSIEVASCENTPTPGIINIPNSFSPNGDGVNDLFIIRGLTENSSVMIYDRSGKKLYESVNYHNDWDGKGNDGNSLESDTYWYVIHISGIPSEFKGFVYLKK